jgi:hypothetical protein
MVFSLIKTNLSVQFLILLVFVGVFGGYLPEIVIRFFYTISLTIRDILFFLLPMITFCCLFSCFSKIKNNNAIKIICFLLSFVFLSNYFSTTLAFVIGSCNFIEFNKDNLGFLKDIGELSPLWEFKITPWVGNDVALLVGLGLGYLSSFSCVSFLVKFHNQSTKLVTWFLSKLFVPVLPFFALGFILKIQCSDAFVSSMHSYVLLMGVIALTYVFYILFLFAVAANFNFKFWVVYLKNVLPVMFTALSTMSSLIRCPLH